MVVLEVSIAAVIVVCVVGGLFFIIVLDRVRRPLNFNPEVWLRSLVGLGLLGVAIAWITSTIF
jgi:Flp pilus assembly protein protease CpaA